MKLFISYARVDKPLCKQIVHHLEDIHDVWYDKRLHAGQDWWDEIQERLEWCEGFIYLLSPESVASEYCQKEHAIAVDAGKHIFPVLIQARTKIPDSMRHIHYANLSEGMEDIITLMNALTIAERRQRSAPPPPKTTPPVKKPDKPPKQDVTPTQALAQAADALEAQNFDNAVFVIKGALDKKPTGRVARMLQGMLGEAETALERQAYLREAEREYAPIRELVQREATRDLGCAEFAEFKQDFPDYDPDDVAKVCASTVTVSTATMPSLLPPPFAWIDIPAGQVTLGKGWDDNAHSVGKTFDVPAFAIAKYPVTNAQFAKFIEAGGYRERKWWTDAGWQQREKDGWTEPRYWNDSKWNGAEQPVVGVSWYEAIAYCQWFNDALTPNPSPTRGEGLQTAPRIILPTEQQWQYAAQGDDGRTYPWGNQWNRDRCNNNVDKKGVGKTTPVTQYEGKGDSPFGVVDMAGNVWEWCLTEYNSSNNGVNGTEVRVLRGGSWNYSYTVYFRCGYRNGNSPVNRSNVRGFRLARSY